MPNYPTMLLGTEPTQNKTNAWLPIQISGIDIYKWWLDCGGMPTGLLKATVRKPDNTTLVVLDDYGAEISLISSSPKLIKILITSALVDQVGPYKVFVEFGFEDGWISAPVQSFNVVDDPVPEA